MSTAPNGRTPYASGGDGIMFDTNEEPQNISQEAGRDVVEEQIASPAELAKAYKGIAISTTQTPIQDSKLINNNATGLPETSMASPQHPTTIENLPCELLVNIFIRLLSKQLAQMRSVSKSWNALLSQSSFVKSHLHRSVHNNDQILLVFYYEGFPFGAKPFTTHSCKSPHLELTSFVKLPPFNPQSESEYTDGRVIGSVNGLICSSYGSDSVIHIWNPSLSAVLTLPSYFMPSCGSDSMRISFRFGFDPKTDDYKVIKLTRLVGPSMLEPTLAADLGSYPEVVKEWLPVEVFSMRKGSWELLTERFPSHIARIFDHDNVCVDGYDGHLHWLGHYITEKNFSDTIVAFDLGLETFREIHLPDSILDYHCSIILGVLGGKLCVMSWDDEGACDVWVMDEYEVVESWVKRHVFSQFIGDPLPYGFTLHNEFLIEDNDCRLVLHDPIANKSKVLANYCPGKYGAYRIMNYIDSLVWLAPAEREMVDGAGQN